MDETGTVTKELVKALRKEASAVSIRIEGKSAKITVSVKVKIPKGFEGDDTARQEFNGFRGMLPEGKSKAYFSDIFYEPTRGNFGALGLIIREGDELTFRASDNQNGYLEHARINGSDLKYTNGYIHPDYTGIHNDTLTVQVMRNGKCVIRGFEIDSRQCPDNSARAIE